MNKKLFVMVLACMLGAIGMTSCIDNKESESVTNIREAKALQLKSLASLYEAQAEAQRLMAQAQATQAAAEKLLAEANAELISTQAEKQRLENELLALQIAYEKALQYAREEAELAKLRAEIAEYEARVAQADAAVLEAQLRKANAEQQIAENAIRYEQEMYKLQLSLQETKANYERQLAEIEDTALRAEIYRLTNNYNTAVYNIQRYQELLVNAKNNLIRHKNGLTSDETAAQSTIADYENDIAYYKDVIDNAKKKIEYLRVDYNDTYELEAKLHSLESERQTKKEAMLSAQNAASEAYDEAYNKYNKYDTYSYINNIEKRDWIQITKNADGDSTKINTRVIKSDLVKYLSEASISIYSTSVQAKAGYYIWINEVELTIKNPASFDKTIAKSIYTYENSNYDKLISELNTTKKTNDSIANAITERISVLDAMIAVNPDTIVNDTLASKRTEILYSELLVCQKNSVDAQNKIDKYDQSKKDLESLYDTCIKFDSYASNLKKEVTDYNNSLKNCYSNYFTLDEKAKAAEKAYNETNDEYNVVYWLYHSSSYYSIDSKIQEQENIISTYELKIKEAEDAITSLRINWATIDWDAYYNDQIAGYEKEIKLWQEVLEKAKAELDAAIKSGSSNSTAGNE